MAAIPTANLQVGHTLRLGFAVVSAVWQRVVQLVLLVR